MKYIVTYLKNFLLKDLICFMVSSFPVKLLRDYYKYYACMFWGIFLPTSLAIRKMRVLLVSKNGQFLSPPTLISAYVIYEWSLAQLSPKKSGALVAPCAVTRSHYRHLLMLATQPSLSKVLWRERAPLSLFFLQKIWVGKYAYCHCSFFWARVYT